MNIFALDCDPKLAARYHVDKHVGKMLIEYAQLMSTCHFAFKTAAADIVYKPTHFNHPSTKWVRASRENYDWLYQLWKHLHDEFKYRYGKGHKSYLDLSWVLADAPTDLSHRGLLPVTLAMPDEFKKPCETFADSVECYRDYYSKMKVNLHSWKNREIPSWI